LGGGLHLGKQAERVPPIGDKEFGCRGGGEDIGCLKYPFMTRKIRELLGRTGNVQNKCDEGARPKVRVRGKVFVHR